MIRGKFIDNILTLVKEVSDDAYLERSQVGLWLDINRDSLVSQYLNDLITRGKSLDSFYMEREVLEMNTEEDDLISSTDERVYVEVSKTPMGLTDDLGVVKVETTENLIVLRANTRSINWVNDLPYAAASSKNLVFYRDGKRMVIQGLKKNKTVDFIVTYIPSYASQELSESDEFKIHDALVPALMDMVEEIARREVMGVAEDPANNGVDDVEPVRQAYQPKG
jgi:hypothetical protein